MFIVEDGTIVEDANSYASVAEFKSYWDDRGFDYTSFAPDDLIEEALVRATDYIENTYNSEFKGIPNTSEQSLSWPRSYVYDRRGCYAYVDEIPTKLKQATIQYAKRALTAELQPDPVIDESGQMLIEIEEEVGPIKERRKFSEAGLVNLIVPYPAADNLLQDLINSSSGGRTIRG